MLNNGGNERGSNGGMVTPEGTNGGMYNGAGPSDYPHPNSGNPGNNSYHHHNHGGGHPGGGPSSNGMMGHHSGGICSQMSHNQQNQCSPNTKACGGCGGPILERFLFHALDRYWHHTCLKCSACGIYLADAGVSCFTRDGMILCRQDYHRIFGGGGPTGACNGCGQGIPPQELVMRAGASPPGSSPPMVFHMKCFTCSKCMCRLVAGDRYSVLNGALYCEQDAVKLMKNGIGSPSNANVATSNGPTTAPRKGKVGRPRRSRD